VAGSNRPSRQTRSSRSRDDGRRGTRTTSSKTRTRAHSSYDGRAPRSPRDERSRSRAGRDGRTGRVRGTGSRLHAGDFGGGAGGADRLVVRGSNRAYVVFVLFAIFAVFIFIRLFYLQVIVAPQYTAQATASHTVTVTEEPRRGTIYDRNGNVLAISVDATTIYANPSEITDPEGTAAQIASVLGGSASDYLSKLQAQSGSTFTYIKQKADVDVAQQLKSLNLTGIYFLSDTRREYPYGEIGGQIIGACNIEVDQEAGREYYSGITGLEYYYNDVLSGTPGYYEAEVGADGTPIAGGLHESQPAVQGQDIVISIDIDFQQALEESLKAGLEKLGVNSGTSVVMDGGTGEIYAAASLPLFNPADRSTVEEGATSLKAVSNLFEPGSIFKTVSAMSILETNTMGPDDTIFCPASITADGYTISDAHERSDATYSLRQIIDQSSNVGISLSTEKMGFEELYNHILTYNLNSLTGIDYPGEQLGYLLPFDSWSRVTGYNVSFGQGISVNAMQMVRFYGALVNDGVECTPHFLIRMPESNTVPTYDTVDVVDNKDAIPQMTSMLKTVVTDGTGTGAAISGYNVAGKTSTAQIYDETNGGYRQGVYNLCFTGFIADSNSKLVCFVGADEVASNSTVTPIFKDIMTEAVSRYNITSK
jgi:cell division protein FtsI (penicillin-binding protein 3)